MARRDNRPDTAKAELQYKRNKCLELRLAGKTQSQIVQETGWSKQNVSRYIQQAIADITRENAEEYLELELQRLDALQAALWKEATSGRKWSEQKVDRVLAVIDQRARMLGVYKTAELKAIADAKGTVSGETTSMLGRLFDAIDTIAAMPDDDEDADEVEE